MRKTRAYLVAAGAVLLLVAGGCLYAMAFRERAGLGGFAGGVRWLLPAVLVFGLGMVAAIVSAFELMSFQDIFTTTPMSDFSHSNLGETKRMLLFPEEQDVDRRVAVVVSLENYRGRAGRP